MTQCELDVSCAMDEQCPHFLGCLRVEAGQPREPVEQLPAVVQEPTPFLAGTFAIYEASDGGIVLVTETARGMERKAIPGRVIKLLTKSPMGKALLGIFGGGH